MIWPPLLHTASAPGFDYSSTASAALAEDSWGLWGSGCSGLCVPQFPLCTCASVAPIAHDGRGASVVMPSSSSLLVTMMRSSFNFYFYFQVNMALAGKPLDVTLTTSRADQWNMVFPQRDEIITSLVSALDSMVRGQWHPCPHPPPSFGLLLAGL